MVLLQLGHHNTTTIFILLHPFSSRPSSSYFHHTRPSNRYTTTRMRSSLLRYSYISTLHHTNPSTRSTTTRMCSSLPRHILYLHYPPPLHSFHSHHDYIYALILTSSLLYHHHPHLHFNPQQFNSN
ncbi:hypothetical protein Pcinc_020914 [Petrolisthes cinctipes]|uniref:Uncharacterized protein n=1 Tax=Petrolisthes cinctipes TaxID=88211 RepID=A0AAE1FLH6_PETCI|nr:hypothetical protein Pcinc_020914 [Petrolisthes cinctipes]